jgi:hypothetical protein
MVERLWHVISSGGPLKGGNVDSTQEDRLSARINEIGSFDM